MQREARTVVDSVFLKSFIGVIQHGSIAGAARQLNLAPGTITLRVKALEKEFGTALVQRVGRTVVATEAGARVFAQARAVIRDIDDLRGLATSQEMVGQLRLGVIASAASCLLPHTLREFDQHHPTAKVSVKRDSSSNLYLAVCEDVLDAALMVEPHFGIPKSCQWQPLDEEPLILLTSSQMMSDDPHAILAKERLIRYDRSYWGARIAEDYLYRAQIEIPSYYEVNALDNVAQFVEQGLGVSLVPDWAGPWAEGHALIKRSLPMPSPRRVIGLLWSSSAVRQRQIRALLSCAERVLARWR